VPRPERTRAVTGAQAREYIDKAEEYLSAAAAELDSDRPIAATSLAVHAAIKASDAVCGMRLGQRSAGQDHDSLLVLLRTAGPDGQSVAKELARLLPLKTKAEYEPDRVPRSDATRAVERARRAVTVAQRVAASLR
jgi:hypothetical protein